MKSLYNKMKFPKFKKKERVVEGYFKFDDVTEAIQRDLIILNGIKVMGNFDEYQGTKTELINDFIDTLINSKIEIYGKELMIKNKNLEKEE